MAIEIYNMAQLKCYNVMPNFLFLHLSYTDTKLKILQRVLKLRMYVSLNEKKTNLISPANILRRHTFPISDLY